MTVKIVRTPVLPIPTTNHSYQSTQDVRPDIFVQFINPLYTLVSVNLKETAQIVKLGGVNNRKEGPEICHVVNPISSEQYGMMENETAIAEIRRQCRRMVFQAMGFIYHNGIPLESSQLDEIIGAYQFMGRHDNLNHPKFVQFSVVIT